VNLSAVGFLLEVTVMTMMQSNSSASGDVE
jgi:hypothetical protein